MYTCSPGLRRLGHVNLEPRSPKVAWTINNEIRVSKQGGREMTTGRIWAFGSESSNLA